MSALGAAISGGLHVAVIASLDATKYEPTCAGPSLFDRRRKEQQNSRVA